MSAGSRTRLIVIPLTIVIMAVIGWRVYGYMQPREYEIKAATITQFDAEQRTAEIQFILPKSGQLITIPAAEIPADCPITLNGAPAELADLRIGDTVSGRGRVYPDRTVEAMSVHATREANAATQTAVSDPDPEVTATEP